MSTIYDTITISNPSGGLIKSFEGTQIETDTFDVSPVTMAEVTLSSTQNLNGYPCPWAAGSYVNKLPYPYTEASQTKSGITFTTANTGVTMNGTATADITFTLADSGFILSNAYQNVIGGTKAWTADGAALFITHNGTDKYDEGNGIEFYYRSGDTLVVGIKIRSGTRLSNVKFEPMIILRGSQVSSYTPYKNVCTFSSVTSNYLYKRSSQTSPYDNSYYKSFGRTVYFGTYDYITGHLISTHAAVELNSTDFEWSIYNASSNTRAFRAQITGMKSGNISQYDQTTCFCTQAKWTTTDTLGKFGWFYYKSGYVYFPDYLSPQRFSTVDDFKAWLDAEAQNGSPVTILYPLSTPVEASLSSTTIKTLAGKTYFDTSATASSRKQLRMSIQQTAFKLPRPANFSAQREDIYAGTYTTCTGATRSDKIGWKYSDMTLSWDGLKQEDVEKLCSLSGECTLYFDDPLGDSMEEPFVRSSVVSMRCRNKFDDEYWWTGVSCKISFIGSHTE